MPSLRRRGKVVSETDMRRHTSPATTAFDNNPNTSGPSSKTGQEINHIKRQPQPKPSLPSVQQQDYGKRHEQLQLYPSLSETVWPEPSNRDSEPAAPTSDASPADAKLGSNRHRRFSVLRFRNASDSQLSLRAKQQAEKPPPVPTPPSIITTAPTSDASGPRKMTSRMSLAAKFRRSTEVQRKDAAGAKTQGLLPKPPTERRSRPSLTTSAHPPPPSWLMSGSDGATLGVSNNRRSESSKSDASSADRSTHPNPPFIEKKAQIPTSFFKLGRARKSPESMFPLAHLPQKNAAPSASGSALSLRADQTPRPSSAQSASTSRACADQCDHGSAISAANTATRLCRGNAPHSNHSSPTRSNLLRGRSSTMSSIGLESADDHLLPPTTRTSTSTGRKSFGDLLGLSRIRQTSDLSRQGSSTPVTPGSITSKRNSFQLQRGVISLPERLDDESPAKFLARLEDLLNRGTLASALSKGTDLFSAAVLRSYMRRFSFFGDPMDMALRKLLMEAELPKETQQIDRCLQAFANRYHECNPGIYSSSEQAYFIAFSLLILHTDVFNKNNKHKMQKSDYLKNTRGEGIFDEILECFYDNISYTPFIHVEDDVDVSQDRPVTNKSKKRQRPSSRVSDSAKRAAKEPVDPYTIILDGNLDALRPNWKDAMHLDDNYNYLGSAAGLNLRDLQKTFFRTAVLQIVSARSRPDAFMTERTASNPEDAHPGIVDIKITKVGLLWRKDTKKRKTRSPWQEWGAILTGAQLYFFRNTSWVKSLMQQYENHIKAGHDGIPIIFKPPLEEFKPDALMSTQGAVALLDATYKKHKNAFVYVRQGVVDEVLLADNEDERNDWLAKLNYAAAFRTSGVRMRGVVGGNYDGQGRRGIRRLDTSDATQLVQTPTGPVSIVRGRIDHKMAQDIQAARRVGIQRKIAEADRKVEDAQRQLEEQLRNARHLQILAPIQPRTRDLLLLAAARMAAQLKWTRMVIWKERCHRDILKQDLADDRPLSASTVTPTRSQPELDLLSPPTPRPLATNLESEPSQRASVDVNAQISTQISTNSDSICICSEVDAPRDRESTDIESSQTPSQSATRFRQGSNSPSYIEGTTQEPVLCSNSSLLPSPTAPPHLRPISPKERRNIAIPSGSSRSLDEVDADERDFLKQTGLWEAEPGRGSIDKITMSTSAESADHGSLADRDRSERMKARRSLQRTLRESAGHLSHHRGRKGKEAVHGGGLDDGPLDTTLTRGTGSFVVHGKKASVIKLGTELQSMSQDEIFVRKQLQQQQQSEQPVTSPRQGGVLDDDIHSAPEPPSDLREKDDRRESSTSAGTATARSFRELHRRYSSAQAARSVSAGGRLAIPSDGESEAAVSLTEGGKSPRPTGPDAEDVKGKKKASSRQTPLQESTRNGESTDDGSCSTGDKALLETNQLSGQPVQAIVNA
ncbi:hypothetical protein CDD83_1074 [Cordyceps sp. RAO-2017]|nr:hypothetical protein CDD83_1074 [Cordyceps sp. RAO-2017]